MECDAKRLETDGLSLARDVDGRVRCFLPGVKCDFVRSTTERLLLQNFAGLATQQRTYDVVLVVGHSNRHGLALTEDGLTAWCTVAEWLKPFSPRVAVLAACQGGRWLPSAALFSGITSLKEIYGTPVISTQPELRVLELLVFYLLKGGKVPLKLLRAAQIANFALTRGVIFRQTRSEFRVAGPAEPPLWTGLEQILREVLHR